MWDLYKDFEAELRNTEIFDPMGEIYSQLPRILYASV